MIGKNLESEGVQLDSSIKTAGMTRAEIRQVLEKTELFPGRRAFGALPHYGEIDRHQEELSADIQYFGEEGVPSEAAKQALLLYRLKFGHSLSNLAEKILSNYPGIIESGGKGKIVSIFGLSGSGKSFALEVLQECYENVVPIDFDTALINLFGPRVREVEESSGATLEEVRDHLIHNEIKSCYLLLIEFLAKKLKEKGYTVVQTAITPRKNSDYSLYIEHDEVDPSVIDENDAFAHGDAVRVLTERTTNRVDQADNFNWNREETETRFEDMPSVSVKVPSEVHAIFLERIRNILSTNLEIRRIRNPFQEDREEAKAELLKQIQI